MEELRRWQSIQQSDILQRITAKLVTSDSFEKIRAVLAKELPDLEIPSSFLALYEDPKNLSDAHMMLAYSDVLGEIPEDSNLIFPSNQLMPPGLLPENRPFTMIVQPLYFQEEQLGYLLIKMGSRNRNVYESLRVQISSAIRGAMLLLHNIELREKAVVAQAVAEEANQMKGRFLSTVSHELRTPLSLLVGLSEMMMFGWL